MTALRPYQLEAIERVREEIRRGHRRILLVLATGGGKTIIASHIIERTVAGTKRALFVAHRREIINQSYAKLLTGGLAEEQVGVLMAGDPRRRPGGVVQVASIDTLRVRAKPLADLVIIDEAHRALAKSYRDLQACYPKAIHLGLTATPFRADGKGLGDAYDALVVVAAPRELIAQGYLVEPHVFTVPDSERPDLSAVRIKGGDYDERALAVAVDKGTLVGNIVEHWKRLAGNRRTIAFAVSIEHSIHIVERFRAAGVPTEHLDGETPTSDRDAILARLASGETRVVSNVGVLCEGTDIPAVKCAILARPTKSTGLYMQQAGRILRPWINPTTGESPTAIILDHAGCALEHGRPQDDREYSLEGAPKRKSADRAAPVKVCEQCHAVLAPATRICPSCGFAFPLADPVPDEVAATLAEIAPVTLADKRAAWERLCAEASARGYKSGWAYHRYREEFGSAPPSSFRVPEPPRDYGDEEKAAYLAELRATAASRGYKRGYVYVRYKAKFGEPPPDTHEASAFAQVAAEAPVAPSGASVSTTAGDAPATVESALTPPWRALVDTTANTLTPEAPKTSSSRELVEWQL